MVYMGLIIKGTIPRVPQFSLWNTIRWICHLIWLSNLPSTQNTRIASYRNAVDNVYVLLTRAVVSIQVAKIIYSFSLFSSYVNIQRCMMYHYI